MFDNMYDTPQAYQDPFAGMSPADKARAQQNDIQLGGNGSGEALARRRGELTPGSANFNQAAYDDLYGNKGHGGTDYGWAGNMINSGLRPITVPVGSLAKDRSPLLMALPAQP